MGSVWEFNMNVSRFERVLTKLQSRSERVSSKIADDLKNVKPFDKPILTPKERLYYYETQFPQMEQQARQTMGDAIVDEYKASMEQLRGKYNG